MNKIVLFIIKGVIIIYLLVCFACSETLKTTKKKNFAYIYNPTTTSLHPEFIIYHKNDSSSVLMIKFYSGELLFNQANDEIVYRAEVSFNYRLFNIETKKLVDSSTIKLSLDLDKVQEEMATFIPIKAKFGNDYILQVISSDLKRKTQHRTAIKVDKTNKYNRQNYLIKLFGNSAPVFNYMVDSNSYFFIEYPHLKVDSLFVHYYKNNFIVPAPPSLNVNVKDNLEKPDSQFVYYLKDTSQFKLTKKGLYVFKVDTNRLNGINLSYYGEGFPRLKKAEDLVFPLKYVLKEIEYVEMLKTPNKKLFIDEFWLKAANNNVEQARDLIRIYYNRTFLANYYFTSYKEGWKTDRGMIYIIYGLPDYIYKSDNTERWIYEDMQSKEKVYFKFQRTPHPFADNHYTLNRSETIPTRWKEAIETWRKGKPFSMN